MIRKVRGGYKLFSRSTGTPFSKKPKTYKAARRQEQAIQIAKRKRRDK